MGARSWVTLCVLAAAVIALASWFYYNPKPAASETYALSALKASDVKRIRFERGDVRIELQRHESAWRMTAPISARADAFQVNRLLTILDSRSSVRYPTADLARFGLDTPAARLTLEDQTFAFGAINATTHEQYVLTGDAVYAAPLGPGSALPRDADALLARDLFASDEAPVQLVLPDFSATLQDGAWRIEPAPADASADERLAWVEAWQHASALRAERYRGPAANESVRVTLKNGPTISIGIVQRDPEVVLVRTDEAIAYHFTASVGKRLLTAPGSK